MKLIVKAKAGEAARWEYRFCECCGASDDAEVICENRETLDGIECDEVFADYIWGELSGLVEDRILSGGDMRFVWNSKFQTLEVWTTYEVTRKLTSEEETLLIDYTQGQWSDGIGEGFEQSEVCASDGQCWLLSPWYNGQVAVIEYEETI